MLTSVVESVLQ